jgi:colanic acid biosynthesis glycosyl transferase WcaI
MTACCPSVFDSKPAGDTSANAPRIVFVNRYFYPDQSATSQLLTDLASALVESGFNVHVICSRQRYDDARARLAPRESHEGVTVHRVWTTRFGRSGLVGRAFDYATFYASCTLALLRLLRPGDTVIAETDPPLISIPAMVAARLRGAEIINWLQDIFPEVASRLAMNPLPPFLDALLRRCRDLSLRAARVNVVLGARMREQLLRTGIPADKILVIENWAERHPTAPKTVQHSALRSGLGFVDRFVVAYSGNLGRAHEFQTLLGAAELLRADTNIVFLMIGGGAGMKQLAKAVAESGLPNFLFLPYQAREALADSLAAADVHWVSLRPALEGFIVPSKFYGILAAARPVIFIGDADGELAREIRACGCGDTVAIGQSQALADLLRSWKTDPELLEQMGRGGFKRYEDHYCARRAFEEWARLLTPPSRVHDACSPLPSRR